MRKIAVAVCLLVCMILVCQAASPSRLIIENQGVGTASVDAWRYKGSVWTWTRVATVQKSYSVPIYPVHQGDRFRAFIGPGRSGKTRTDSPGYPES